MTTSTPQAFTAAVCHHHRAVLDMREKWVIRGGLGEDPHAAQDEDEDKQDTQDDFLPVLHSGPFYAPDGGLLLSKY
jgi:hypothetical protein